MNAEHLRICASSEWRQFVTMELLPWTLTGIALGDDVLEVGPGPGVTTDVLRSSVERVTALELDGDLATALSRRLSGSNVTVAQGDGRRLPFPNQRFSAVALFTMLHHVPREGQTELLAEARRVLRPGGVIVGTDGIDNASRRELHVDDDYYPVAPAQLARDLESATFVDVVIEERDERFRFAARRPEA